MPGGLPDRGAGRADARFKCGVWCVVHGLFFVVCYDGLPRAAVCQIRFNAGQINV